jgi:uncharacterized protein
MTELLTPHQTRVAHDFLDAEEAKRRHLVVSLSGAHAYGFPSPDSDLDLKAIHVAPTSELLGLGPEPKPAERLEVIEGVEVDYSSNEIQPVLKGILHGNGNYLERVLGHLQPRVGEDLASLRPLVKSALSRNLHRHYSGFARQQFKEWEKTGFKSAKKLLYVVRTSMTGVHALLTGEITTDVTLLVDDYGLSGVSELIAQKKRGEKSELPDALAEEWRGRVTAFLVRLDEAVANSSLPSEPSPEATAALETWLLEVRRKGFGTS